MTNKLVMRPYQAKLVAEVTEAFKTHDVVCLASAPGSGKTEMAIKIISQWQGKIAVSAHAQNILKAQFIERAAKWGLKTGKGTNITVFIPQSNPELPKLDLLVIDEAHEWYLAKTMKDIIKAKKPRKILLLTGTPSKLLAMKVKTIFLPLMEVPQELWADLNIQTAECAYNFKNSDYNQDGRLKRDTYTSLKETKDSIKMMLEAMSRHLKLRGDMTDLFTKGAPAVDILNQIDKTIIACHNATQAGHVQDYFKKIGVKALLSTAEADRTSAEFTKFQADPEARILIVLERGILGFNYLELMAFVDFTATRNPDLIYQMLMRVCRRNEAAKGVPKLFIKMAIKAELDATNYYLTCALHLTSREGIEGYKGIKTINDVNIPVIRRRKKKDLIVVGTHKKKKAPLIFDVFPDQVSVFHLLSEVYLGLNEDYVIKSFTTLRDVKRNLGMTVNNSERNKEFYLEFCRLYGERP